MKFKHLIFWQIKGQKITKFNSNSKNKVVLFFNSSSSITYILLNNSNIAISVTMSLIS